jgi:hypothetical protein
LYIYDADLISIYDYVKTFQETREIPDLNQKYPALSGTRLRMSISAADLIGKTVSSVKQYSQSRLTI